MKNQAQPFTLDHLSRTRTLGIFRSGFMNAALITDW